MDSRNNVVILLMSLLLIGAGCAAADVSSQTPEEAAASLLFVAGDELVVRPTVLGAGGTFAGWLGKNEEERRVKIEAWVFDQSVARVDLSWSIASQVETDASRAARAAHTQQYASSPVGVEIPQSPKPVYEERVVSGRVASESMGTADTLLLPEQWPQGDGGVVNRSLIWLSRERYEELVSTRSTVVSLGLFDESLARVENATSRIASAVEVLSALLDPLLGTQEQPAQEVESDSRSFLTLEAEPQWGTYTLLVNGVRTKVRIVEAKNAFASYKILANPDNPLILEIQLTPLSQGNLELLSRAGVAKGFSGYEVTRVSTPSEDRPQP